MEYSSEEEDSDKSEDEDLSEDDLSEDEDDDDYDDIIAHDEVQSQKNNTYYLTIPFKNPNNDEFSNGFLYDVAITSRGFFKHPFDKITKYIRNYSPNYIPETSGLEIVQTKYYQKNGYDISNILIKTFWLKIVQRRWRNILKHRKSVAQYYHQIKNREYNSNTRVRVPGLRGCLFGLIPLDSLRVNADFSLRVAVPNV